MNLKHVFFILFIVGAASSSFAQKKEQQGYEFSNDEMREVLLFQSKTHKTKAFLALAGGPALTALGIHLVNKYQYISFNGSTLTTGSYPGAKVGYLIGGVGITTTLSSILFFTSSARLKKEALRLPPDQLSHP